MFGVHLMGLEESQCKLFNRKAGAVLACWSAFYEEKRMFALLDQLLDPVF